MTVRPDKALEYSRVKPLARPLLQGSAMALGALTLISTVAIGCVYPAPIDLEAPDAGVNSPPVIIAAGPAPDFSFPGPLRLSRQENPLLSLTVNDNDVEETLYVRFYVDYGMPDQRPARSGCVIPPTTEIQRVGECLITPVCGDIDDTDESLHFLEAVIADRPFLEETDRPPDQSPHRGLPEEAGISVRAWTVACEPAEV